MPRLDFFWLGFFVYGVAAPAPTQPFDAPPVALATNSFLTYYNSTGSIARFVVVLASGDAPIVDCGVVRARPRSGISIGAARSLA